MSIRVEVASDTVPPGCQLGISGEEPSLGVWDAARVVGFRAPAQGSADPWVCEIPVPTGGSQFKLMLTQGTEKVGEPVTDNRRWPSHGLHPGATCKLQYGQPKMAIEASPAHIEATAKATKKIEEREGSALQENIDKKGENAYYHAHTRKFEVPEDAKVITGPGLITGGPPTLIETGGVLASDEDRTVWLKDYSWADSTGKIKVYVPIPEGVLPPNGADEIVETEFKVNQVDLLIKSQPRQKLKIEKLNGELKVESCITRVEAHKSRIVLQLAKKRDTTWYSLTKK